MENERTLKVYYAVNVNSIYPMIRIMGKWLLDAGFKPGDYIKLKVQKNEIEIKNMLIREDKD